MRRPTNGVPYLKIDRSYRPRATWRHQWRLLLVIAMYGAAAVALLWRVLGALD